MIINETNLYIFNSSTKDKIQFYLIWGKKTQSKNKHTKKKTPHF